MNFELLPLAFKDDAQRVYHDLEVQCEGDILDIEEVEFTAFDHFVDILGIAELNHAPAGNMVLGARC